MQQIVNGVRYGININRQLRGMNEGDASDVDVCRQLKIKLSVNVNIPVINLHFIHFWNILIDNIVL